MYDNRLSIWNPGVLPEDWSLEKLLGSHASQPYNPNIANAFSRTGEIEMWGRGIERVFTACREAGVPEPEFGWSRETFGSSSGFPRRILKDLARSVIRVSQEKRRKDLWGTNNFRAALPKKLPKNRFWFYCSTDRH